jgi:hypothetical protein
MVLCWFFCYLKLISVLVSPSSPQSSVIWCWLFKVCGPARRKRTVTYFCAGDAGENSKGNREETTCMWMEFYLFMVEYMEGKK